MSNLNYPYSRPNVTENDIKSVIKVLRSQYLAQGSVVKDFENQISKKFNVKNTIVCNSGTAALHSVYKCLGLNKKNGLITQEIICICPQWKKLMKINQKRYQVLLI